MTMTFSDLPDTPYIVPAVSSQSAFAHAHDVAHGATVRRNEIFFLISGSYHLLLSEYSFSEVTLAGANSGHNELWPWTPHRSHV